MSSFILGTVRSAVPQCFQAGCNKFSVSPFFFFLSHRAGWFVFLGSDFFRVNGCSDQLYLQLLFGLSGKFQDSVLS